MIEACPTRAQHNHADLPLRRHLGVSYSITALTMIATGGPEHGLLPRLTPHAPNPPHRRKIHPDLKRHGVLRHHVAAECADVHVGVE